MAYDYEVTVIGGGPGGYVAAIAAAQAGKRTCLVEKNKLGGTCLNEGCIPTKTMVKSAELFSEMKEAEQFGIIGTDADKLAADLKKIKARKDTIVKKLVGGVAGLLAGNGVKVLQGSAAFQNAHSILIDGKTAVSSEYFILATGSEAVIPKMITQEGNCSVITSREALDMEKLPEKLAILGGGVIGIEFAYVFSRFGCEVTVLEMMDRILPMLDREVSALVQKKLEKSGVQFYLGASVKCIRENSILFEQNGEEKTVKAQMTLMAAGRKPYTEGLAPEKAGLELDRAAVVSDEKMQSNVPNIYVIGDVNGRSMLAHTAFHEAETAVKNICGGNSCMRYDRIPSCVYIDPEVGSIGLTEEEAREKYGDHIKVGRFPAFANGRSMVEGDTDGMFKVITDDQYGEILGVHLFGKFAAELIVQAAIAMEAEATAEELIETVFPHPTVGEGLGEAFLSAWKGRALHSL